MYKIGEFSKLALVTVRTLRHYDELGLLKPEQIDRFSGYRYYSLEQLGRLNRILALKDMGLSLEQISQMLDTNPTRDQILGMLKLKQMELQERISQEQTQLHRVSAWLTQLERENEVSNINVTIKKIPAIRVISLRDVTPTYSDVRLLFDEMQGWLAQNHYQPQEIPIVVFYDEEYKGHDVDQEVTIPIPADAKIAENERIKIRELPELEAVASTIHHGNFDGMRNTYIQLMNWVQENGYQIIGENREIYHECDFNKDPSTYRTEIMFPVAKA